ncbi:MAG: type I 3-dehydroquinate dehydratase [Thermoanaerobaculales bacterium]
MDWIVSLTPEAAPDLFAALANPPSGAGIVELRLDLFPDIDIAAAVSSCSLPILATVRSGAEGGVGPDDPVIRSAVLRAAREAGAALLDLEHRRDGELIDKLGLSPEQIVLSWHDPEATPADLEATAERMIERPARWVKIVPTARCLSDLQAVLDLHQEFNSGTPLQRRLLTFAMGSPGLASRYLAPLLGPPVGYSAWTKDAPAAPGQLTIERTEAVISHLSAPPQRLYGVVGAEVAGSLSPILHAAGYRALGLPYILLPVSAPHREELSMLFASRGNTLFDNCSLEARGWAVTSPYKREAAASADQPAPRVQRAGAANTLILGSDHIIAENTDADGVVGSLTTLGIDPCGRSAVVQGSGGAARGAAVGLYLAGADVFLRSRSVERAQRVADEIGVGWCPPDRLPKESQILVNATPLGSERDEPGPFEEQEIARAAVAVDMVYADFETHFAARARDLGVALADGREVLLHQGYAQFAAFTNSLPPKEEMRKALRVL